MHSTMGSHGKPGFAPNSSVSAGNREDRFGMRDQKGGHALIWLAGFDSRTGGQTLRGTFEVCLHSDKSYTPSLYPPRTCNELRCLWGSPVRAQGKE